MDYIIVQAGGKGSRLGYLTANRPKALVPVENLPMLFHLFQKYPDHRFLIIADYHKEVLRSYLDAFAGVNYLVVDAEGTGTASGVRQALALLPEGEPFMLVWSDLILPAGLRLPEAYEARGGTPEADYIGISKTFPCRWKYEGGAFSEEPSTKQGVAGFFLFTDKSKLRDLPESGELVRWMRDRGMEFSEISLAGTREYGLLEEFEKLGQEKCRPFNRITVNGDVLTKEPVDAQGRSLAVRECAWYEKARHLRTGALPAIYGTDPLRMEYIHGRNIYECRLSNEEKARVLETLVNALHRLHAAGDIPADPFSMKEAYFRKTMNRLDKIRNLVPFAGRREIIINGRRCRNVYFHRDALEQALEKLSCDRFPLIHGDCTFSNLMLRDDGSPVLIDPRGYFGFTEFYGDVRYDWAKLYYSIAGNYDRFNLKQFRLEIGGPHGSAGTALPEGEVRLDIASNGWEGLEDTFFSLTGADPAEIRLLHGVIWLSLTTYAWQDYDSVCGAFYNGLYHLEEAL